MQLGKETDRLSSLGGNVRFEKLGKNSTVLRKPSSAITESHIYRVLLVTGSLPEINGSQ